MSLAIPGGRLPEIAEVLSSIPRRNGLLRLFGGIDRVCDRSESFKGPRKFLQGPLSAGGKCISVPHRGQCPDGRSTATEGLPGGAGGDQGRDQVLCRGVSSGLSFSEVVCTSARVVGWVCRQVLTLDVKSHLQ